MNGNPGTDNCLLVWEVMASDLNQINNYECLGVGKGASGGT